jgi:hypothetical protein
VAEGGAKKPDSRGLSFFDITDFSPGIYYGSNVVAPGADLLPSPPGAADVNGTVGCMVMPNGGLGPLPGLASEFSGLSLSSIGITVAGAADISAMANSVYAQTFNSNDTADEILLVVTTISGGFQTSVFYSWQHFGNILRTVFTGTYNYSTDHNTVCYPFATSINTSGGSAQPCWVIPIFSPDGPLRGDLLVYPSIAAPTTFSTDDVVTRQGGMCFGHQGRIVQLTNVLTEWPLPSTVSYNPLNYTDPSQTETWPAQFETFGPENSFGYGAVNSVSAGELFLVKARGGGLVIQGDLNNPTVTSLPAVKSTGVIFGRSDTDPNGMYYCSQNNGAWVWGGGNASTKISNQLDDNFFSPVHPLMSTYYSYYCQRWGDWMLFSNNWVYDTVHGGWWRLENPSSQSYFWYSQGIAEQFMWAALPTVTGGSEPFLWEYDRTVPRSSFTWRSLPIRIPVEDRTSTARELVIRASNPYADAAPQIDATLIDDKGNASALDTWTMTPGTNTVQEVRLNAGVKQTTTVAISLAVSGTTAAPVVHSLSLGSRAREHAGLA